MRCSQVQDKLLRATDKELSTKISKHIRDHLLECQACEHEHRIFQEAEKSLQDFGDAVRSGHITMESPPMPEQPSFWSQIRNGIRMPIPLWVPSMAGVVVILIFSASVFSPVNLSIEWGVQKGGDNAGSVTPPLSAERMLEFLIVPEPTDAGQLAASIEAVETFLKAHPDDLAMHVKLVELYRARLKLGSLNNSEREVWVDKLSLEQRRFLELLENFRKGVHNATQ